jgi:hypothetical protein
VYQTDGFVLRLDKEDPMAQQQNHTHSVSAEVFRQVYDSPVSLPGRHRWLTSDEDVRKVEEILGMPQRTIGAPLWVSGDRKECPDCGRETNWLDIVSSALERIHSRAMIARVILGSQKFVNMEAPRAIAELRCFECGASIDNIRSFKCHNWAYADRELLEVLQEIARNTGD